MSKKLMERVTAALKKAKVELSDEAREALSDVLGSDQLTAAGFVELGSGQQVVETSDYNELHKDVRLLRDRAQKAESKRDELKATLDAGDSDNKKRAEKLDVRNRVLEPLVERLMKRSRGTWAGYEKKLPAETAEMKDDEKAKVKAIRGRFAFAADGQELDDNQVLDNLHKYDELSELGLFGEASAPVPTPTPTPPPAPRGGGNGGPQPVDIDDAYKNAYANAGKSVQQNAR